MPSFKNLSLKFTKAEVLVSNLEENINTLLRNREFESAGFEIEFYKDRMPDFVYFRLKASVEALCGDYLSARNCFQKSIAAIRGKSNYDAEDMVLFGSNGRNFGDRIQEDILNKYNISFVKTNDPSQANLFCTGSVLHKINNVSSGVATIMGAGLIYPIPLRASCNINVIGLRGMLSAEALNVDPVFLGDPGIIVDGIYEDIDSDHKKNVIGLVPHYNDQSDPIFLELVKSHPDHIVMIDVRESPRAVCDNISKCEYVIASSLHGLIVALSFGIPAAGVFLSAEVMGNGFKFYDFISCFKDKSYFPLVNLTGYETITEIKKMIPDVPSELEALKGGVSEAFLNYSKSRGFSHVEVG